MFFLNGFGTAEATGAVSCGRFMELTIPRPARMPIAHRLQNGNLFISLFYAAEIPQSSHCSTTMILSHNKIHKTS